jgi:hypothetical protein
MNVIDSKRSDALTPHFPAQRSLDDRRQWVSLRGLTRPDARRCHPAKALRYQPQRNSRLGVPVTLASRLITAHGASLVAGRNSSDCHMTRTE